MTKSIKNRWTGVLKSGNRAIEVVLDAIAHVKEHGDTSLLAHMIHAADVSDNAPYSKRLRKVTGLVFPEAKIRKNKDGGYSITRGDSYDETTVTTLKAAHSEGFSLIGPKLGELIGEQKEQLTTEQEIEKRAKSLAKWVASHEDVSLEQFLAAVRSEYQKQTALKAVA